MFISMDKFNKFLSNKYQLFTLVSTGDRLIFYVSEKELTDETVVDNCIAWIETVWFEEDNEMCITWITTHEEYRGNGLGSFLIIAATTYYKQEYGCKKAILDDFTDYSFMINNIYTKLGFEYINKREPEMIGKTNTIIKKWESFINKNKNKKFYN